jgi:hypothetical protein
VRGNFSVFVNESGLGLSAGSFLREGADALLEVEFTGGLLSRSTPSSEGAGRVKKLSGHWINRHRIG